MRLAIALTAAILLTGVAGAQAPVPRTPGPRGGPAIQPLSRLIDVIDVDEHENQVDITLQFNCSLRYAGHAPASEGPEVRLRLRPDADCGFGAGLGSSDIPTEIPPISGPRRSAASRRTKNATASTTIATASPTTT